MAMRTRLDDLPKGVAKGVQEVLAEEPELPLEAAVGLALRRRPELIRDWREWERQGRPSQREQELEAQLGTLDKLRSDAVILGAEIEELRRRARALYPKPPVKAAPPPRDPREVLRRSQGGGAESWTLPVRKDSADWRAGALEAIVADLYALADALPPNLARRLLSAINELGAIAEEIGGESARRRLKAMAAV